MKTTKARSNDLARKAGSQNLGRWGENLAAEALSRKGYTILARNARTPYGELDLVARQETPQGAVTVFVEVKTRRSGAFGLPEASVTPKKQAHLLAASQAYLQANPDLDGDWRVDVIAIRCIPDGEEHRGGEDHRGGKEHRSQEIEVVHFENAVQ